MGAADELKSDYNIVRIAVQTDGRALQHAADELRGDCDIVRTAVLKDGGALRHATAGLRSDRDFLLSVLSTCPTAFAYVEPALALDREFVLMAVRQNAALLEHLPDTSAIVVLECDGMILEHSACRVRSDPALVYAAV